MNNEKEKLSQEERVELKQRVLAISDKIGKDYIGDICRMHPKLNNKQGRILLVKVRNTQKTDSHITEILEAYVQAKEKMLANLQHA